MKTLSREEEIIKFAHDYSEINYKGNSYESYTEKEDIIQSCIDSIHWADQHPKSGLWDAEKVCKWISERISIDQKIETNSDGEPLAGSYIAYCIARQAAADTIIKDLRKAMNESND